MLCGFIYQVKKLLYHCNIFYKLLIINKPAFDFAQADLMVILCAEFSPFGEPEGRAQETQ